MKNQQPNEQLPALSCTACGARLLVCGRGSYGVAMQCGSCFTLYPTRPTRSEAWTVAVELGARKRGESN